MSRSRYWCGFCDNTLDHDEKTPCPNVVCLRCGGKGHYGVKCTQLTCERCLDYGHLEAHCYERPRCRHCRGFHLSKECPVLAKKAKIELNQKLIEAQKLAEEAQKAVVEEKEKAIDISTCIICKDQPRQWLALPCCHFLYCETCLKQIPKCSVCNTPIKERRQIFS